MNGLPVTPDQLRYVNALCRRHSLSLPLLDTYCERQFGTVFAAIDRAQCSALIDDLKEWQAIPAALQRAAGQMDLFGARP